jgi:hypothetical protein
VDGNKYNKVYNTKIAENGKLGAVSSELTTVLRNAQSTESYLSLLQLTTNHFNNNDKTNRTVMRNYAIMNPYEDGGSFFLRNIGTHLQGYTLSYPRRSQYQLSPLENRQVSHVQLPQFALVIEVPG